MIKLKNISFKVDEDNDIYELIVNGEVFTLDTVYDSKYATLFDDLNVVIDLDTNFVTSTNVLVRQKYMNIRMEKHIEILKTEEEILKTEELELLNLFKLNIKTMKKNKYYHPVTKVEMSLNDYMKLMFGEEFIKSKDKGTLKEY